jgi:uncharacterized protein (TIGR01777 family)
MKIIIPGGTGQIGCILRRALCGEGHDVVTLSRSADQNGAPGRIVRWDGHSIGPWIDELRGADILINLAGRSVNCRYTAANRRTIWESRIASTRCIAEAISRVQNPPALWLQAGTATIYGHRYDAPNDEYTGWLGRNAAGYHPGWGFSVEVAKAWEQAVDAFPTPRTRKILMRSAMTMSVDAGGVFDVMLGLVRKGLGGTNGNGRQFVSWIHAEDFWGAIRWIINHENVEGIVNLASPQPLPNRDFMRYFREAWGMPVGLPSTEGMLAIGAVFLQTETELILKSRRVIPARLLEMGFEFRFPDWRSAVRDLCERYRAQFKDRGKGNKDNPTNSETKR